MPMPRHAFGKCKCPVLPVKAVSLNFLALRLLISINSCLRWSFMSFRSKAWSFWTLKSRRCWMHTLLESMITSKISVFSDLTDITQDSCCLRNFTYSEWQGMLCNLSLQLTCSLKAGWSVSTWAGTGTKIWPEKPWGKAILTSLIWLKKSFHSLQSS